MIDEPRALEDLSAEQMVSELVESTGPLAGNLLQLYQFGQEVEEFIRGNKVGAYVVRRVVEELHNRMRKLLDEELTDEQVLREVREARTVNLTIKWLHDVIADGLAAQAQLEEDIR